MSSVDVSWPHERVALLLIDNGPRNFITWSLNDELESTLVTVRERAEVVVLGSAVDGYFLAHGHLGDNVETFTGGQPSGDPMAGLRVLKELDTGPMVSIAAIDGQAWGGGAELAWACDLRVAGSESTFAQVEVRLGVTTVGGAARIAHLAGEAAAKRLVLDGRPIDAEEAFRLGLVHWVVEPGRAVDEAVEWARWLVTHPPGALAQAKAVITANRGERLKEALEGELRAYVEAFSRDEALDRARAAQDAYDRGADSYDVFDLPREG
jgi:enoyl-CoA hydratase/carnithine racemase